MEHTLEQETAVITGSDSGIGQATAIAFAKSGADVAVTYMHDKEGAENPQREVETAGRKAIVVHLDQRDPASVEKLFRETQEGLGTPTILVNDAGIDASGKPVKDMTLEEWADSIRTNL